MAVYWWDTCPTIFISGCTCGGCSFNSIIDKRFFPPCHNRDIKLDAGNSEVEREDIFIYLLHPQMEEDSGGSIDGVPVLLLLTSKYFYFTFA